jgi:hypothetical protein
MRFSAFHLIKWNVQTNPTKKESQQHKFKVTGATWQHYCKQIIVQIQYIHFNLIFV